MKKRSLRTPKKLRNMESELKPDILHKNILDNPKANRLADDAAIKLAVAEGMTREEAEELFGGAFDPQCMDDERNRSEMLKKKKRS